MPARCTPAGPLLRVEWGQRSIDMTLWIIFALMTAAAILAVAWPLARKKTEAARAGSDVIVYQDQLQEIDRDCSAGLIGEADAEAVRIEVSRRLLAAADKQAPAAPAQPVWHRRAAALAVLIVLSLLPAGLCAALGSPNVPGRSAIAAVTTPPGHESIANLSARSR
jgi:cytochrome c-type biogenesis protein CcmH